MEEENESEEEMKGFKISDRRFAVRGYEDEDEGESGEAAPEDSLAPPPARPDPSPVSEVPPSEEPPSLPGDGADAVAGPGEDGDPDAAEDRGVSREFETLLAILQTNAIAAMGINPQTGERVGGADPRGAKMFVDMISMVKEKMAGNLSEDEERLMAQVLSDLQLMYVQNVGIG